MTRRERDLLRSTFTEAETAIELAVSALADMRTAITAIDERVLEEVVRGRRGKLTPIVPQAGVQRLAAIVEPPKPQPQRETKSGFTRPNRGPVTVTGGVQGAVAASMRRAIATEAADALRGKGSAMRTSEVLRFTPTARKRYKGTANQVAALGKILKEMGQHYHVRNVSDGRNCVWVFEGPRK